MKRPLRFTAALLALCLTLSLLSPAALAVDSKSYFDLNAALASAQPGSTITLPGDAEVSPNSDDPWIIDKNITINGNGHMILLRRGGILLGANATFQNVQLSFTTSTRNAIIANGYALTLDGVTAQGVTSENVITGGYPYNVFGGTLLRNVHETFIVPTPGTSSTITIQGKTSLQGRSEHVVGTGNIYAGSLAMGAMEPSEDRDGEANQFSGNVVIDIKGAADSTALGIVYAGGAQQRNLFGVNGQKVTRPDPDKYTVDGTVTIQGAKIPNVDGAGSATTNVVYQGDGNQGFQTFANISSLTVESGHLLLKSGSTFRGDRSISISSGTKLDLQEFANQSLEVGNFHSDNGFLFLGTNQTLTVSGQTTGTAKIAIGGTNYNNTQSSFQASAGHIYITAPNSSDGNFQLLPHSLQPNMTLVKDSSGNWTASNSSSGGEEESPSKLESLSPKDVHEQSGQTEIAIPLNTVYSGDPLEIQDIPKIFVNGSEASFFPDPDWGY